MIISLALLPVLWLTRACPGLMVEHPLFGILNCQWIEFIIYIRINLVKANLGVGTEKTKILFFLPGLSLVPPYSWNWPRGLSNLQHRCISQFTLSFPPAEEHTQEDNQQIRTSCFRTALRVAPSVVLSAWQTWKKSTMFLRRREVCRLLWAPMARRKFSIHFDQKCSPSKSQQLVGQETQTHEGCPKMNQTWHASSNWVLHPWESWLQVLFLSSVDFGQVAVVQVNQLLPVQSADSLPESQQDIVCQIRPIKKFAESWVSSSLPHKTS